MVAELWILKMGNQVSNNLKHALYLENSRKSSCRKMGLQERQTIGILSFEVANVMSKIIHLHKSLTDNEILKLKNEILRSEGIRTLVSSDEKQLLELALYEKLDDLNRIANVVSRLGKKCTIPALQGFEHVYDDIVSGVIAIKELSFLVKDMQSMVRKIERYVNSTVNLYTEMEVMNQLEVATKKFQNNHHEESRKAFEQKLTWQKQDVRHLKDVSLWNQTYDKVVELLARTVCTIYARIYTIFRDEHSIGFISNGLVVQKSASTENPASSKNNKGDSMHSQDFNFACGVGPGRMFMECLSLSSSASKVETDDEVSYDDGRNQDSSFFNLSQSRGCLAKSSKFRTKNRFPIYVPPSSVGASALALHYANIVIVLEKFLRYPHLVGEEARDDLYQMLPTSLRKTLKTRLKSYVKDLAIYDAPLAHDWREKLDLLLKWLAPMAHNTIRWQNERNFEQQQIVKRTNVLLLQTLYFGDQEKTEEAIFELIVGLNYICRYEQQQNALLDCASSFDFDEDYMEWQLEVCSSF